MKLLLAWLFIGSVWAKANQALSRMAFNEVLTQHYLRVPLHVHKVLHVLNTSEINAVLQKRVGSKFSHLESDISGHSRFRLITKRFLEQNRR